MQSEQATGGVDRYKYCIQALEIESKRAREILFRFSEQAYAIATQQVRAAALCLMR